MNKKNTYSQIKDFARELYQNQENYRFLISEEMQQEELHRLKSGLREEQFFVVIDLLKFSIIDVGGVEALGYNERQFTLQRYFEMIPSQGVQSLMTTLGKQTFLHRGEELIGFLKPSYIVQLPIKVYQGNEKIYLVKRVISPWQITKCGKITAYLSHFTIIKEYNYEGLEPRLSGIPEHLQQMLLSKFNTDFNQLNSSENKFSPKQLIALELYLDETKSTKEIALLLKIGYTTLKDYNKEILKRAREMFGDDIPVRTAKDVALYLKSNGLLR